MATDWLRDYDPLFDLFDEEMRASQVTPSDYLNEYDLNSYNPNKLTDELSIILGLEWMPCLDLNSPTVSSSSPSSSSATSPASSTVLPPHLTPKSAQKRRKRCLKTKGTSLLAQPSPKLNCTTGASRAIRYCVKIEHAYSLCINK